MLRNYLLIALRNIGANPLFSVINVAGLALGLACCMAISVFVSHELSYDKHWTNADRIYRVTRDFFGNDLRLARVAPPVGPLLAQDYAEIEDMTRAMGMSSIALTCGDRIFPDENMVLADHNLFDFFEIDFVQGDINTALSAPTNIILSQRAADRIFGGDNPIGKTVNLMNQADMTVAGIFKDLPDNTHMSFELVASIDVLPIMMGPEALTNWGSNNFFTYLLLPDEAAAERLEADFPEFMTRHRGEGEKSISALGLQRLTEIHLTSNRDAEWRTNGSMATVQRW